MCFLPVQYVYAHFPINLVVSNNNKVVEVKNYLGEKMERVVELLGDTTAKLSKDIDGTKDEITIQGSSLDAVSQSCANIQQIAKVKDKDIRKFLDGGTNNKRRAATMALACRARTELTLCCLCVCCAVYVSYRGSIVQDD